MPPGPIFFQFHAVFRKFWQNRALVTPPRMVGAPISGKSWIRHSSGIDSRTASISTTSNDLVCLCALASDIDLHTHLICLCPLASDIDPLHQPGMSLSSCLKHRPSHSPDMPVPSCLRHRPPPSTWYVFVLLPHV